MSQGTSIIDFGDISKPATVLIEKISDAVGGLCKPWQTKRVAKAEAEAEIIRAESQIQITDLQRRAVIRWIQEEGQKQVNMERIIEKAIPQLMESAAPQNISNDWIANFFDRCRIVSDDDMQTLWANILAGEANLPGTYARQTVNIVGVLDKQDAQLFTALCGFTWHIGGLQPLIFNDIIHVYASHGISFGTLSHLDALGLIRYDNLVGFIRKGFSQRTAVRYYDRCALLEWNQEANKRLKVGVVMFTRAGEQLFRVSSAKPVDGFYEHAVKELTAQGVAVRPA